MTTAFLTFSDVLSQFPLVSWRLRTFLPPIPCFQFLLVFRVHFVLRTSLISSPSGALLNIARQSHLDFHIIEHVVLVSTRGTEEA